MICHLQTGQARVPLRKWRLYREGRGDDWEATIKTTVMMKMFGRMMMTMFFGVMIMMVLVKTRMIIMMVVKMAT